MLTVPQLFKKFLHFIEPNGSLSRSQDLANGYYRKPNEPTPHNPIIFLYNSHPRLDLPSGTFSSSFPIKTLYKGTETSYGPLYLHFTYNRYPLYTTPKFCLYLSSSFGDGTCRRTDIVPLLTWTCADEFSDLFLSRSGVLKYRCNSRHAFERYHVQVDFL